MFESSDRAEQALCAAVVLAGILFIAAWLIRVPLRKKNKPWSVIFVGTYNVLLLLLYVFGDLTQVTFEGFGFLPLMALTLPLSFFSGVVGRWVDFIPGDPFTVTLLFPFVFLNVLCGATNSCVLFLLLRRWQRKRHRENAAA
jgi:hypothetical protein